MKIVSVLLFLLFTVAFWLAVDQQDNEGKKPEDEQFIQTQERSKVTGELYNVEIVKCRICGQVLSYVQRNLKGKLIHASIYSHHCGKYGIVKNTGYNASSLGPTHFNLIAWLDKWQKRLRIPQ